MTTSSACHACRALEHQTAGKRTNMDPIEISDSSRARAQLILDLGTEALTAAVDALEHRDATAASKWLARALASVESAIDAFKTLGVINGLDATEQNKSAIEEALRCLSRGDFAGALGATGVA